MAEPTYQEIEAGFNKGANYLRHMQAQGMQDTEQYQQVLSAVKNLQQQMKSMDYGDRVSAGMSAGLGFGEGVLFGGAEEVGAAGRAISEDAMQRYMGALRKKFVEGREAPLHMLALEEQAGYGGPMDEGMPFMDRYQQYLEANRRLHEQARAEDPWMYGGAELAGGLTTAGLTAPKLMQTTQGAGTLRNLLPLMKGGAGYGGTSAYLHSEADPLATMLGMAPELMQGIATPQQKQELQQQAGQAGLETLGGATLGAVSVPAFTGATNLMRGLTKRVGRMLPSVRQAEARELARQKNYEKYVEDMKATGKTEAQIMDELDIPGMSLQEVGPHLRGEAALLTKTSPEAAQVLREFNRTRNVETLDRFAPEFKKFFGVEGDNLTAAMKEMAVANRKATREAYDAAYSKPVEMTRPMLAALNTKMGKKAVEKAKEIREARLKNPDAINIEGHMLGKMQSTKDMDAILRDMSRQVALAYKPGPGKPAQVGAADLKKQYENFRNLIYKANPEYAAARKQYGDEMSNLAAANLGKNLFKMDVEDLEMGVDALTKGDHDIFKMAALKSILKELQKKPDESDLFKGTMNRPDKRRAIELGFGNEQNYREFEKMVRANQEMFHSVMATGANKPAIAPEMQEEAKGLMRKLFELVPYSLTLKSGTGAARTAGAVGETTGAAMLPPQVANTMERRIMEEQAKQLIGRDIQALTRPVGGGLFDTGVAETGKIGAAGLLSSGIPYGEYGYPE